MPVGTVLVVIGGDRRDGSSSAAPSRSPSVRRARHASTPLVRKIAQELGVDLDSLTGTGPQGRITEEDVRGTRRAERGHGASRCAACGA